MSKNIKAYAGYRIDNKTEVYTVGVGEQGFLDPRLDLANHSPTGFEWGYEGSGPAQLALAILADYLSDDERAKLLYQQFKRDMIAQIQQDDWLIIWHQIDQWLGKTAEG